MTIVQVDTDFGLLPVGPMHLKSGREVYNTGKVLVGCLATNSPRDAGVHADALQTALLRKPAYDVERAGHRAVLLCSIVGLVAVVAALIFGAL